LGLLRRAGDIPQLRHHTRIPPHREGGVIVTGFDAEPTACGTSAEQPAMAGEIPVAADFRDEHQHPEGRVQQGVWPAH
jgi:hypothetical protein